MRIAVTGAGGFLGTHLLRQLRARFPDAHLSGVVRSSPAHSVVGVTYAQRLEPADYTLHLAGGGSVGGSLRDPVADLLLNTRGTVEVLEQLRTVGTGRLVIASSAAVYGRLEGLVSEGQPASPVSPYGVSKLASELYVHAYESLHGLDACVARIGNAYGPGQRQLAIYDLARRALRESPPLRLHGTGEEVRDFIHASDVADSLIIIAQAGHRGATYNVASGHPVSMKDVARMIALAAGHEEDDVTTDGSAEPGKANVFCPSIQLLTELGFEPGVSLEQGIVETMEWVRCDR
ncbi:MAG: NAD-dependent epimerase/dehydratase family protein [Gammaproteobacteria bacterium]|nr:NAD-dependent epimerase/dehydratase family protein [Gammaproteobacteria bacterium]